MAQQLLSPGVFVQEVPSPIKAIAGVGTSTPGFIGAFPKKIQLPAKNSADPAAPKFVDFESSVDAGIPKMITNWTQFTLLFGDFVGKEGDTATTETTPAINVGHRHLAHAVYGFFNNGGSRCFVVRIDSTTDVADALHALDAIDEVALVAMPGSTGAERDTIAEHCENIGDRFGILDGPATATDLEKLTESGAGGLAPKSTTYAACYFPWIKVFDPATKVMQPNGDGLLAVPPSGHIAGIYGRVDADRGVHKTPANEVLRGALELSQPVSRVDQDALNPKGVNCIREVNGNIYVWGGRTVGGDGNADMKYISVRRTVLFLRESIDEGMQWVVFEPNTPQLWQKITRNVTAFLTQVWRAGALFGNTPQEAFFVKCDAENNPPADRENGKVTTEIGVAIVRPAEFVVFKLSQFTAAGN